jgi:hypothetical protein
MNVQSTTNLCNYVMHPSRIVGLVFEGIVDRVRACWQWLAHSQIGAQGIRYLQEHYIQSLDRTDRSVVQSICVLAVVIPVGGRLYFGPAPTPLFAFAFVALLSGGYRLMKNRREFTLNQQVVARIPATLTTVRQAVDYRTPYSQTLNVFKNFINESRFSHLEKIAARFEGNRSQFENANGRRPLADIKTELSQYLAPIITALPPGSALNLRFGAFRTALNHLGTPAEDRAAFRDCYDDLASIPETPGNQAQRQEIARLKELIEQVIDQPAYERSRQDLIGWLERFQTKLEERLPWWKLVIPLPEDDPLE